MLTDTEPTGPWGYHGCGYCPTWAQHLAEVLDPDGQPLLDETGAPVLDNDQVVSSAELWQHVDEAHPDHG